MHPVSVIYLTACLLLRLNFITVNSPPCCLLICLHLYMSVSFCRSPPLSPARFFSPPLLPPSDPRSPSCPSTSRRRRTTATCRWTAGWPTGAARRGSSSTSSDATRWTGLTRCAGTLTSSRHTLTHPAARDWCWQVAIRWSIKPQTGVVVVVDFLLIDRHVSARQTRKMSASPGSDACCVSFRSQRQMRRPARRTLKHPTAPSAGEWKEWTATARSETARIHTTTRNTTLWRYTHTHSL